MDAIGFAALNPSYALHATGSGLFLDLHLRGGFARQPLLAQLAGTLAHRFLRGTIFGHGHGGVGFLLLTHELPVRGCALLLSVNVGHADITHGGG